MPTYMNSCGNLQDKWVLDNRSQKKKKPTETYRIPMYVRFFKKIVSQCSYISSYFVANTSEHVYFHNGSGNLRKMSGHMPSSKVIKCRKNIMFFKIPRKT